MKRFALSLMIMFLIAVSMIGQTMNQSTVLRPSFPPPYRDSLLNGLQVIVVERPSTNNVAINYTIRTGALFDVVDRAGLADLVADLIMTGGTLGWGQQRIAQTIDTEAPDFKITTGWDTTSITATTKAEDLQDVLGMIGALIGQAKFDKPAFEKAKTDRINRLRQSNESPDETAKQVLASKLYPHYPLGHSISGTAQSISNITISDVLGFYRRFYLANNSSLVVVGNSNRETVTNAARSSLGQLLKGEIIPASFTPAESPSKTSVYIVDEPTGDRSYLAMGQPGIARTSDAYFPALVLNYALAGGPNSRLSKKLGEEHNYSRNAVGKFETLRVAGPFVVTAQTSTSDVSGAVAEVVKLLSEVRAQGLTNAEIEGAKDHFISSYDLKLETNEQLAERLSEIESYGLGRDYILNYKSRVAAVTVDQVRSNAGSLLRPDALVIVAVGPASRIKDELAKLGPVEMVNYDPRYIAPPPPPKPAAKSPEAKPTGQPQ